VDGRRLARLWMVVALALVGTVVAAPAASATVSISRAELNGSKLRIEGTAIANRTITVNGVAMGTSDGAGSFRIQRDPFTAPADCTVDVNDGSSTATRATLSGCTVSSPPPASPPPPSPSPSLSSLSVSPIDIIQGDSATGTVTLTSAAPSDGFEVDLEVVDMAGLPTPVATVPPNVIVPAAQTSATFTVSTFPESRGSAMIVGTVGGDWNTEKHRTITVYTEFHYNHGSISILPSGNGSGRVTSQPAGIDCTITRGNGSGTCWSFFPVGTVVRLDARPASDSRFVGWRANLPGCGDASKVTVARGADITCGPGFFLR
jgi:hypothetical protein